MVAVLLKNYAAAATPWAWLPDENATTLPPRASCGIEDSLLKAPRNLNEPVRCSISGFRKTLVPARSLRTGGDNNGVRTANGASTRAAASISAALIGKIGERSAIPGLYRGPQPAGNRSGDQTRALHRELYRLAFRLLGADVGDIFNESACRSLPGMSFGKLEAGLRRNCHCGQAGDAQIFIQRANGVVADHVARTGHRKRRHRQAACERLEQNEAKRVGLAREHEDVGGGIGLRQLLAVPRTQKHGSRIVAGQRGARRSVTDNHLGTGQIEFEKRLEILFDRNAADAQKDRAWQPKVDRARVKLP